MGKKYIIILMQVLTSICIVSVGFASWTIVSGVKIEESGTISAEDVHSNDKYIEYVSHDVFRYYDTGFVSSSGKDAQILLTGTLKYSYKLHLNNLIEDLDGKNSVIKFSLTHPVIGNYQIISDFNKSATVKVGETVIATQRNEISANTRYIEIKISELKNLQDGATIVVEYTFAAQTVEDFKEKIYPCFVEPSFEFINKVDVLFDDGE